MVNKKIGLDVLEADACSLQIDLGFNKAYLSKGGFKAFRIPGHYRVVPSPEKMPKPGGKITLYYRFKVSQAPVQVCLYVPFGRLSHTQFQSTAERLCLLSLRPQTQMTGAIELSLRDLSCYGSFKAQITVTEAVDTDFERYFRFTIGGKHAGFCYDYDGQISMEPKRLQVTNREHIERTVELFVTGMDKDEIQVRPLGGNAWLIWSRIAKPDLDVEMYLLDWQTSYCEMVIIRK